MSQAAKPIDVTRSFLPIDPNAYPETLHGTEGEDSPEKRVPVSAYIGYNILPTMYGYKSYFGTNRSVNVDALPARADYVFVFQNATFRNILVALTERGVYIKAGDSTGAWTQAAALVPPPNETMHYDWSWTIIDNNLYAYQQGRGSYYEIKSNAVASGVDVTAKVPNFLNMAGQVGIFRAAGRLAFWDTAGSIGWSSLDDYTDFTPDIESLAGNATFSDVVGTIVTCLGHGDGFIIYATKSIIYIQEDAEATYQWKPKGILNNIGITYPRNVVTATPDTTHFAWTSNGMYKIEKAEPDVIVPEVTDFLKESNLPIYLNLMEGRHLVIESLDPNFLTGYTEFTEEVVPPYNYTFPGSKGDLSSIPPSQLTGVNVCNTLNLYDQGAYDDMVNSVKAGLPGGVVPADKKPGTNMTPIWTCYLSVNGAYDPNSITFGNTPCATVDPNGVEKNLSPTNYAPTYNKMTQDSTNKRAVTGPEMYADGNWTMERFIAVQTALWEMEEQNLQAAIEKILNRSGTGTKTTSGPVDGTNAGVTDECAIGRYVNAYSSPQFGFSACQFWLTRYAIAAIDIKRVKVNRTVGVSTTPPPVPATYNFGFQYRDPTGLVYPTGNGNGATAMAAVQNMIDQVGAGPRASDNGPVIWSTPSTPNAVGGSVYFGFTDNRGSGNVTSYTVTVGGLQQYQLYTTSNLARTCPSGYVYNAPGDNCIWGGGANFDNTETMNAYNKAVPVIGSPPLAIDCPYCTISGFKYTANDNSTKTVSVAAGSCTAPSVTPGGVNAAPFVNPPGKTNIDDILGTINGSVCSRPFEPVTIPGSPTVNVDWPDQVVTIPAGSFLLRQGSIAPIYPDFFGFLSYDLQLKKWGKMAGMYKNLIDYSPVNSAVNGVIPYTQFSIRAGVLKSDGKIYLFDNAPLSSRITYGKIGYYRLGMTSAEEVRVQFRTVSTGKITVDTSLDGRVLGVGLTTEQAFSNALDATLYGATPGKWQNITISGIFDINYLEYRGFKQGRR